MATVSSQNACTLQRFHWLPHIAEGITIGSSSLLQYVALQWCHLKDVGTSFACAIPYNLMNLMHLMLL